MDRLLKQSFSPTGQLLVRLFIAALIGAAVALVLVGGTTTNADEFKPKCKYPPAHRGKSIVVTDNIPPELLPAVVARMTPRQFEAYAKQRNEEAYAKAQLNHDAYLAVRGPLRSATLIETGGTQTTRYGGGAGYNGVGGSGGYNGYHNNIAVPYAGSGGGGGYGGQGLGQNFVGNTMKTTNSNTQRSYSQEYPDLNDAGGGGVTLINPYCFDYWRLHTEDDSPEPRIE